MSEPALSGLVEHVLDRPVWHALCGDHAHLALGGALARRYPSAIGPLAAARDGSPEAGAALGRLIAETGPVVTLQVADQPPPAGTVVTRRAEGVQLVFERGMPDRIDSRIVPIDTRHAAAMTALASLTEPGPFALRTCELGPFYGVFEDGELIAMAGQRTRFAGFVEVSAVCTHPDWRGRGLAGALIDRVAAAILSEGRTPFLTSYADNASALALYRRLGFVERAPLIITVLSPDA